jgi:hypothetical protein
LNEAITIIFYSALADIIAHQTLGGKQNHITQNSQHKNAGRETLGGKSLGRQTKFSYLQ